MGPNTEHPRQINKDDATTNENLEIGSNITIRSPTKNWEAHQYENYAVDVEDEINSSTVMQKATGLTYETPYSGDNIPLAILQETLKIDLSQNAAKTRANEPSSHVVQKENALAYETPYVMAPRPSRESLKINREQVATETSTHKKTSGLNQKYDPQTVIPGGEDYIHIHPSARSWEIGREQVNVIKVIGKGAFSEVAKATVWNLRDNEEYVTVAAKMLKGVNLLFNDVKFSNVVIKNIVCRIHWTF